MEIFSFFLFCLYFCALLLVCIRLSSPVSSAPVRFHSISPNFSASHFEFIDSKGVFLESINGTFTASIANPIQQTSQYYFSVTHTITSKVIWSANRNSPISNSAHLYLTKTGLQIVDESNRKIWSTPELASKVSAMWLLETGNLILADERNASLWESFDYPTDTLVMGQRLSVGKSLDAAVSDFNLSVGEHSLSVTDHDAILQWEGVSYWKLSMDTRAFKDTNAQVSFMVMNQTGLYLYGANGTTVVMQVGLDPSEFKIAKMGFDGRFIIMSFGSDRSSSATEFSTPLEACSTPFVCGKLGLCSASGVCSCVPGFHSEPLTKGTCVPSNTALSLPSACNNKINIDKVSSRVSYNTLNPGLGYFATDFIDPVENGLNFSSCTNLCTDDCSCLGFFYRNYSGSCYLLKDQIGSMILRSNSGNGLVGSVKVLVSPVQTQQTKKNTFPLLGFILIPFSVSMILVALAIVLLRRRKLCNALKNRLNRSESSSSSELELIPGLPVRFDYEAIAAATENFQTQIGSGGFGIVYKGTLPDKTVVAVKSITSFGTRGKKGFGTEIAVIANIHHVNLVKLKGFCAQGSHRFLVLEYMNRGSLDHILFDAGPVLEWHERFEIALGTARGLAYLHSGCGHKIIHCDIKPENILLHDKLQAKISDFGLSKLLGPDQSFLFTTLRGTRGYLAPEWLTCSSITDKTDVYSYGMVLLEIISGRKNSSWQARSTNSRSDNNDEGNNQCSSSSASDQRRIYFPLLALKMHQRGNYLELADPRLEGRVTYDEVEKLTRVALSCLHEEPTLRPTMENIVAMLEGRLPPGEPRIESLNFLRFYGERFSEPSTVEASPESNPLILLSQRGGGNSRNVTTDDRHSRFSCISSQQLSGPR